MYVTRQRISDGLFEVLTTNPESGSTTTPLTLLTSYPTTSGGFVVNDNTWSVDNGRLAFAITPTDSTERTRVALFDSGKTTFYDLESEIFGLTVFFRS